MSFRKLVRSTPLSTRIYGAIILFLLTVLMIQARERAAPNTVPPPTLPENVTGLVITAGPDRVDLTRREDRWYVKQGEESFPADADTLERLVQELRELPRLAVVTRRGNYGNYGLADATTRNVRVEGEGGDATTVELGHSAAAGDAVYGRVDGDAAVVRLPRTLHHRVSTDPDDYREMVVARISENSIREIAIHSEAHGTVRVHRSPADDGVAEERDTPWEVSGALIDAVGPVQPQRFRDLFQELGTLSATGFPSPEEGPERRAPFVELEITTVEGTVDRITIEPPDQNRRFPASATTVAYPFYLAEWRVRRLLLGIESYLLPFMEDPPEM